ncbi:MAG: protein kinase [Bacteroidales bacterium]|nr:protein kinase [Bacteroidales bacterium]
MSSINDEYEKLQIIGQGAFATIWKVRHRKYGYIRTLKILNTPVADENDHAYQQFLKECTVLLNIGNGSNNNIVHIYQPRLIDNRAVVEMDYIDGETLDQYLRRVRFMPIDEVMRFIGDIGGALAYCHHDIYKFMMNPNEDDLVSDPDNGQRYIIDDETKRRLVKKYAVTHNDLHSNNVMRRENDGSYVLLDFGLAIQNGKAVKSSALRGGALEYMSPEKFEDNSVITTQSDIYSFGILMYEALAGRVPFVLGQGASFSDQTLLYQQHKTGIPPSIEALRREAFEAANPGQVYQKDYPEWLEAMINKCLSKNPIERYSDAKELMNEFKKCVASKPVASTGSATATGSSTDDVPPATPTNLIACPDCGKMISKKASACPHCGRPMQKTTTTPTSPVPPKDDKPKPKSKKWIWWMIGGIVALAAIIVGISIAKPQQKSDEEQIKETSLAFLKAIDNIDFYGAKAYATPESAEALDAMAAFAGMAGEPEKGKGSFHIDEVTIDGESAVAKYTRTESGKEDEQSDLKLQKYDGKWLVKYTKEGMGGNGEDVDNEEDVETTNVPAGFVDLGLPSGLLWCDHNVGASSQEDYGNYYAWGETCIKKIYDWSTYHYCNGGEDNMTKYCTHSEYGNYGFTDGLTTLQSLDDVAAYHQGGGARMPSKEEWQELLDNTTNEWTTRNGVEGMLLKSNKNGNTLFLPAAGSRWDASLHDAGSNGYYWSSNISSPYPYDAWNLVFNSGGGYMGCNHRYCGRCVRPVCSVR